MKVTSLLPSAPSRGVLFLACLLAVQAAAAQEVEAGGAPAERPAVGIGVGTRTRPYAGVDRETRVLPLVSYENAWLRVGGAGADFKLAHDGPVGFGAHLQYMRDGYKASDSPVFEGMSDRKAGVWLGPSATWRSEWAKLSFVALGDVSGHSKGFQTTLAADRTWRLGAFALTPHASATWLDAKYVAYYYGVSASEATATRAAYAPGSTIDFSLGLRTAFLATPHHTLFVDVSATSLGDAIRKSPLVDRSGSVECQLGYLYRF